VSPSSLPGGAVAVPYTQTVTGGGGTSPYSFALSLGALPTDLTLAAGGSLSGTPSEAGTFTFTIQATDAMSFTGSRAFSVTMTAGGLDLTVFTVYITQATQTQAFDVPLVKDRNGYLRAFVIAGEANSATPQVRVRVFDGGNNLVQTYTLSAPGASVPTSIDESNLSNSWNQLVPGSLIQPGYSLAVDVDPDNLIGEASETNNAWPSSGSPRALDVRDLPVLNMTLVPVTTTSGTGDVDAAKAPLFMDYTRRLQPIPDYNAEVRAVMNSAATLSADGSGWDTVLDEVTAQRLADGSSRHYFGVVHVTYGSGVAGFGWIGYPVAIGWDYLPSGSWGTAHEIGHNWDYDHTACTGSEDGPDPHYPYVGGIIGAYGYDLWTSALKDKTTCKDVMSYCSPRWISDYTYKKILNFREDSPTGLREEARGKAAKEPCLLIWGLRRNGVMLMEPSFHIATRPSIPTSGPYRVEGLDASGQRLWSQDFDLMRTTHPTDPTSAGFCFAVPMSVELLDRFHALRIVKNGQELVRLESTGPRPIQAYRQTPTEISIARFGDEAVNLTWDSSRAPVVMVRDLERDECIGFARNGSTRLSTSSRRLQLLFSDGIHTRVQTWPQE
jgi:hypothetical protein